MNWISQIARVLVGALFIFSGLIKLNDPMGFAFKLGDYFAPDVLNLPFLSDYTLSLALFIVILEVLLGVALLLGKWKNTTVWLLLLMIVFFTFLTFYSAFFNKVTDCGCFGDAIPLTPWQSFGKDVVLTVLIGIIFMNRKSIKAPFGPGPQNIVLALSLAGCIGLAYYVLNHLPIKDFRPYAEGKSIVEGMKSAEELGLEATEYATIYTLKNSETGETEKVSSDLYISENWWQKKEWEIVKDASETVILKEGYEPPIHDFSIDLGGVDVTEEVLEQERIFLLVAYNLEKSDASAYERMNTFALAAADADIPFLGLTSSLPSVVSEKSQAWNTRFSFATMDETTLKTIVRANPGVLLVENGVIVKKWHHQDLPSFETLAQTWR